MLKWISLAGIMLASYSFYRVDSEYALRKPLWRDEAFELKHTCAEPLGKLLLQGASPQCSPPPLYYVAQKASILSLPRFDDSMLKHYREVSLLSSALAIAVTASVAAQVAGPAWVFLPLVFLAEQPLYHQYAAENRPYMAWIFLFGLLLLTSLPGKRRAPAFAATAVLLSATAGPGMLQVCGAALLIAWHLARTKAPGWKRELGLVLAGAILSLAVGGYYAQFSCENYDAMPWDLLKSKDPALVFGVVRLLLPKGSALTQIGNGLLLLGLLYPIVTWVRRRGLASDEEPHGDLWFLSVALWIQLGVTLVIAILVAYRHYYFIQRVFIHLILIRSLLILIGGVATFGWVSSRIRRISLRQSKLRLAVWSASGLIAFLLILKTKSELLVETPNPFAVSSENADCTQAPKTLLIATPSNVALEEHFNFVAKAGAMFEGCRSVDRKPVSAFAVPSKQADTGLPQIQGDLPANYAIVRVCGREAKFE